MTKQSRTILTTLAAVLLGGAACSDGAAPGMAHLRVVLTDAPSDYIASAQVTIGAVELLPGDSGGPITLTDQGGTFDLLTLQDGVTGLLAELDVPAGDYHQLRLVVASATVTLADGYVFTDSSTTRSLTVPSGAQTGIKINLASGDGDDGLVTIATGQTILVVDFDVLQSFRIQGNPETPAGISGVLFTPVLRATVQDIAGSIAGAVTDGGAGLPGMIVRATSAGGAVVITAETDAEGAYVLRFVPPGEWVVTVDSADVEAQTVSVDEGQDVTGIDFALAG